LLALRRMKTRAVSAKELSAKELALAPQLGYAFDA
jgi:hypothetical protein